MSTKLESVNDISRTDVLVINDEEIAGPVNIEEAGKNLWHVTASFSPKDNTKDAIPLKLREIKKEISKRFQHPETLLRYRQL